MRLRRRAAGPSSVTRKNVVGASLASGKAYLARGYMRMRDYLKGRVEGCAAAAKRCKGERRRRLRARAVLFLLAVYGLRSGEI